MNNQRKSLKKTILNIYDAIYCYHKLNLIIISGIHKGGIHNIDELKFATAEVLKNSEFEKKLNILNIII